MKKTVVFGASPNPARYAHMATTRLKAAGHEVLPLGFRQGEIAALPIITDWPETVADLDTVTLYVGPHRQPEFYDYILGLNPKRIVFNPGTENAELEQKAAAQGIETEVACTLVLLSMDSY